MGVRSGRGEGWDGRDEMHPYSHGIHGTNGIFTYIWLKFMVNAGKYSIHGCYGMGFVPTTQQDRGLFLGEGCLPRFLCALRTFP